MQTLIDPFELASSTYVPPPARAPMQTISIDVEIEPDEPPRASYPSDPDSTRESWGRVRCWCSED